MDITLESVTGGKEAVLAALAVNPNFTGARVRGEERTSIMAVGVAHEIAREKLRSDMIEALAIRLDAFTILNGERSGNADEWDEALSDEIGSVLEPYATVLSQDWLYPHVDDSRLYMPGEIQTFAHSFAEEVWKQLTYKRTTAQILAGVGIVDGDILKFIQSYKQPKKEELHNVSQLNAVLNKIILSFPDEDQLEENLDIASDEDATMAATGMAALGLGPADVQVLKRERAAGETVDHWAFLIVAGEMLPVEEAPKLPPPPPPPPLPPEVFSEPPPAAPKAPPIQESAPPGTKGRNRTNASAVAPPGTIPQATLVALKTWGNLKDEDLASMFGVSRPTMNNYMRGKGHCVPTPTQRLTLLALVDKHLEGLQEAREKIAI